jgi:transposase
MRHELTDHEWTAIRPMLPNKPRRSAPGERPTCPRWLLLGVAIRSTAARRAHDFGPYTTCSTTASFVGGGQVSGPGL